MAEEPAKKNNAILKTLVLALGFLVLGLIIYLIISPFYPLLKYEYSQYKNRSDRADFQDFGAVTSRTEQTLKDFSGSQTEAGNRIIIVKIGVNAPIIESMNSEDALSRGAWHMPESGTPPTGGNTVVTAHRFKYLPPNNLTFYLLDKLAAGDIVSLRWEEKIYYYKVREKKIVGADDQSILASSDQPILTLFTCDPIWSEARRLVIAADLMK